MSEYIVGAFIFWGVLVLFLASLSVLIVIGEVAKPCVQ